MWSLTRQPFVVIAVLSCTDIYSWNHEIHKNNLSFVKKVYNKFSNFFIAYLPFRDFVGRCELVSVCVEEKVKRTRFFLLAQLIACSFLLQFTFDIFYSQKTSIIPS